VELIGGAKAAGAAILGLFYDRDVRDAVADRLIDIERLRAAA
jgi:alpha-D-ribose 1-methylphosphonate 5-triphosphate synthase subunit PhnL